VNPQHHGGLFVLGHGPQGQSQPGVVGERPKNRGQNQSHTHHQQALDIHEDSQDLDLPVHERFQYVIGADKALEAADPLQTQALENDEAHRKGGNDFGGGQTPKAAKDQPMNPPADHGGKGESDPDGQRVGKSQVVDQGPSHKARQDVNGAMGEVGDATNPVDQAEADGVQGEEDAVDGSVYENRLHGGSPGMEDPSAVQGPRLLLSASSRGEA